MWFLFSNIFSLYTNKFRIVYFWLWLNIILFFITIHFHLIQNLKWISNIQIQIKHYWTCKHSTHNWQAMVEFIETNLFIPIKSLGKSELSISSVNDHLKWECNIFTLQRCSSVHAVEFSTFYHDQFDVRMTEICLNEILKLKQ